MTLFSRLIIKINKDSLDILEDIKIMLGKRVVVLESSGLDGAEIFALIVTLSPFLKGIKDVVIKYLDNDKVEIRLDEGIIKGSQKAVEKLLPIVVEARNK